MEERVEKNVEKKISLSDVPLQSVNIVKLGIFSTANTLAIFSFFVYLILGIIFSVLLPIGISQIELWIKSSLDYDFSLNLSLTNLYLLFLLVMPIGGAILSWFVGIIFVLFYNISGKITKGIRLYS